MYYINLNKMLSKVLNVILAILLIGYAAYYIYKLPKYNKGELAPDFTSTLINGETFTLSSLRGDYVLLDFWGSWCGPCRMESPSLVALNNKYSTAKSEKGSTFHMVSVAVERDPKRWKAAIQKDKLEWPYHIYEKGRFKSAIVKDYGVKEIPTKYLIGPDRNVLMTNPTFDELNSYLSDKLKSKS